MNHENEKDAIDRKMEECATKEGFENWKGQYAGLYKPETPEPMATKDFKLNLSCKVTSKG